MDILIKGIDMPKGDEVISLVIASDKWCAGFNEKYERIDAEATPISTPHGRLLDLRDIAELACRTKDRMTLRQLSDLPTVIEAEE